MGYELGDLTDGLALDVAGIQRELTGVIDHLTANFTPQVRSIAKVTKAGTLGDLSDQIKVDCSGEVLGLKKTVKSIGNGRVRRKLYVLRWKSEVRARVNRAMDKLGGQAVVSVVRGVFRSVEARMCCYPFPLLLLNYSGVSAFVNV